MPIGRSVHGADSAQTDDPDGQQQRRYNQPASTPSSQSFWDVAGLAADSGLGSPSSAPTGLSFESFGQPPSSPATSNRSQQRPHMLGQGPRVILPPRPPKAKSGHERKRTKLSTESTPFDDVNYWIQFDNEEGAGDTGGPELNHQKGKEAQQPAQHLAPHQSPQQSQRQR